MSNQKTDRFTDKAAVSVQIKRPGYFSLRKTMKLATEQPTKWQNLVRESNIVTDRVADKAASSLEKKRQSKRHSGYLVKAT
jgi:hypothetical protein